MSFHLPRLILIPILAIAIWQCITIAIAAGITRSVSFSVEATALTPTISRLAARRLETVNSVSPNYIPAIYLIEQVTPDVAKSIALMQQITSIQPREPRAWGRLFQLHLENEQTGDVITSVLNSAEEFGQWDPVSNWLIVDAGTRYWLVLNGEQRKSVLNAGARSLASSTSFKKNETTTILEERGFLTAACSLIVEQEKTSACR